MTPPTPPPDARRTGGPAFPDGRDAGAPGPGVLPPRTLVLASAGSGKTYRISSSIIALLEAGEAPERILASTFARKAAGEILNRVLQRLAHGALEDEAAAELSGTALLPGRDGPVGRGRWLRILADLVRRLHRTSVGTLDSFFVRATGTFSTELGLPATWSIADEPTSRRLETEALQDVLGEADRTEIVELVRALMRGEATRAVQDRLLDEAGELRDVLHELDPAARSPWEPFRVEGGRPTDEEWEAAARAVEGLEAPLTKKGAPHSRWARELERVARATRDGDAEELVTKGLPQKVVTGEGDYYRHPITPEMEAAVGDVLELARRALVADYAAQAQALERLARDFDEALSARQRAEGAYGFNDLTRILGGAPADGGEPLTARSDLWYRLDQRVRHLLLDEFQDTSVAQWLALSPLAEELLSGHRDERAAVVVADPKQSIYGWRGAEPGLVKRIGRHFNLDEERMHRSWRSSKVVLDFVNRVFHDLPDNGVWDDPKNREMDAADRAVAADWAGFFEPHAPHPDAPDRPGYVRVVAGPRDEGVSTGRTDRPLMMRRAAEVVEGVRSRAPRATVGVLTRSNDAVARIISELRERGIEASEEGGTRLTDSPAVLATLALLRLADHPGHTIAAYQVARSPLGDLLGFRDWDDEGAARRLSRRIRRALLRDGYGATLDAWTRGLARARQGGGAGSEDGAASDDGGEGGRPTGALDERGLRRMLQLVEAGFRWDDRATLRPGDFVRFVEAERVEDPLAAPVRVMTVHRAKGLEFDVVVLPELDAYLRKGGGGSAVLPERDPDTNRIRRVFPYVSGDYRPLFPEVDAAYLQHRAAQLRDALGVLYVGLTRARNALHVLVSADDPDRGPSTASTHARLLREALGKHEDAAAEGEVLHEEGDARWFRDPRWRAQLERRGAAGEAPGAGEAEGGEAPGAGGASSRAPWEVRLAERPRSRSLAHRAPSDLEDGSRVELDRFLKLSPAGERARLEGTIVHEWCRRLGWLDEDGIPSRDELLAAARPLAAPLSDEELRALLDDFRKWLKAEPVRRALSRGSTDGGEGGASAARLELRRELPFATRLDEEIVRGAIDRLVLERDDRGRALRARVLDFKTDQPGQGDDAPETRAAYYRPQIDAYRQAVSRMFGVDASRIGAALVFLRRGVVEEL